MMWQDRNVVAVASALALTVGLASGGAQAAPVDLSSWTANGGGTWVLQAGNDAVLQTVNSPPTIFHSGLDSQNTLLKGTIEIQTTGDDDFIGFVLGYQDGELFSDGAVYYLVDWKQFDQSGAEAGLAFSRVTGDAGTGVSGVDVGADLFQHDGVVEELERGLTLSDTGWADNTEYSFEIIYTATNIQVFIDDVLQFDIDGVFEDGAFGFYNFSQASVLYAGIEEDVVDPPGPPTRNIPEPATLLLVASGLLGLGTARWRRKSRG